MDTLPNQRIVYFNGHFIPELEARVPLYDSALQIGDMAFEVTRTFHQQPFRLKDHLERLFGTLTALRIEPPMTIEEVEEVTLETLARNLPTEPQWMDWQIIHNFSRGLVQPFAQYYPAEMRQPTMLISCFPLIHKLAGMAEKFQHGVDLRIPRQRAIPTELLPTHIKTRGRLHYKLADLELAESFPGTQAVLIDPSGQITEGTNNNFFMVKDGRILTPPEECVLIGITRDTVLGLAKKLHFPVEETRITPEMAQQADEIFVTSTSVGVLHARSFQGNPVGEGQIGPISRELREALHGEVGLSFAEQAAFCAEWLSKQPADR